MNELKQGIITKVLSGTNSFKTAIGSRFYYLQAPQKTSYPYAVFSFFAGINDRDSKAKFETYRMQVIISNESLSSSTNGDLATKFIDLFDDCESSLSVNNYKVINVERTNSPRDLPLSTNAIHTLIEYLIEIEKNAVIIAPPSGGGSI